MIWILALFVVLAVVGALLIAKSIKVRAIAAGAVVLAGGAYWAIGKPGTSDQPYERRIADLDKRADDPAQAASLRLDELIALMKHRAGKNPKDPAPHFSLAQFYDMIGRQAEGQVEYRLGLERAPDYAKRLEDIDRMPPEKLAESLDKGEIQPEDIVGLLEYRAWQTPSDATQRLNLARLYETLNRPQEARLAYEAAVSRAPNNPKALAGLAGLLFRAAGEFDDTIASLYRRAYEHDKETPSIGIMAALDVWRQGRKDEAEQMWAAILAKLPPDDGLRRMYSVIRSTFAPPEGEAPTGGPPASPPAKPN